MNSRAKNTTNNYGYAFGKFKSWCNRFSEIKSYPAESIYVALYLSTLIQSGESYSVIEMAYYGIKWHHAFLNNNPCNDKLCKELLEAGKRLNSRKVKKKDPVTIEHIKKLLTHYNGIRNCSLLNLRTFTIIVLGYSGLMRYSEISDLKRHDFVFEESYVKIFIEKSKTDQYRDGHWLFLAKTGSHLCPVNLLKVYFHRADIKEDSEEYIFRAMTYFKSSDIHKLRQKNTPLSYPTARENVLNAFTDIGLDAKRFGLHSLRSGGASAAANNGVSDRLFKRHGRWKSDKAKDGYVEDSLKSLLSVSSKLGL